MNRGNPVLAILFTALAVVLAPGDLFAQTFTTLDDPLGVAGTQARGIDGNNVVGDYLTRGIGPNSPTIIYNGFLYDGSTFTAVTYGHNLQTIVNGISGNNIVGFGLQVTASQFGTSSETFGFLYNGSSYTNLSFPMSQNTEAWGISGNNIVGFYGPDNYYFPNISSGHGFIYNILTSTYTTLDDPLGVDGTYALGISGNNIVGYYVDGSSYLHGFLYNGTTYTTLDDPFASEFNNPSYGANGGTFASGISGNNIVGYYEDDSGEDHGFVYNILSATYTTFDDPLSGVGLHSEAFGIDGNNVVGDYESGTGPYLADGYIASLSVPEPSSIVLFGPAAIGFAVVARRKMRTQAA